MTSDILQDDVENLEVLQTAFPNFIRDNGLWKQCYFAYQTSWLTKDFHVQCDSKGPTLTIIQLGEYIFGGFVEQSWGGKRLTAVILLQNEICSTAALIRDTINH